jgi:uncharacterized RDD family membrane protein YckC
MFPKKRDDLPKDMEEGIGLLDQSRPRPMDLAPIAVRASAVFIDVILAFILLLTIDGIILRIYGAKELETHMHWVAAVLTGSVFAAIQIGMETLWGTTPAKYAFNLRVVRPDGLKPRAWCIVGRFILRFPMVLGIFLMALAPWLRAGADLLQFLVILAGIVCFFIFKRRTHSDLVTGTRVVYLGARRARMK